MFLFWTHAMACIEGSAAWQRRYWNILTMHGVLCSLVVMEFICCFADARALSKPVREMDRPASGLDCGDLDALIASHDR